MNWLTLIYFVWFNSFVSLYTRRFPVRVCYGSWHWFQRFGLYKDLPKKHHVLKKAKNCEFCNAKRFPSEGPAFCCGKGKVNIYIPEWPAELRRLFANQTDRDIKYFWKHIRYFNSHLSFTSFGVSIDHNLASAWGTSVYCFKAHSQIYLVVEVLAICSYTFMTPMRPLHIGSKGRLSLILQWSSWFWAAGQPICASIQESRFGV
jgi:hypothetical protein